MEIFAVLISTCGSLLGVLLGAWLTGKRSAAQARRDEQRTAYANVLEVGMRVADDDSISNRYMFMSAVYAARLITPVGSAADDALSDLQHSLGASGSDLVNFVVCLKAFFNSARDALSDDQHKPRICHRCRADHHEEEPGGQVVPTHEIQ